MSVDRTSPGQHDGMVLVLDGPSRIGKSTTIAALQGAWPRVRPGPLLDVGLDHTFAALGRSGRQRWWEVIRHHPAPGRDAIEHVAWGPLGRELVAGMHRASATWARAGFDVVVEHVLLDRTTVADLAGSLDGLVVVHVGLTCELVVLEDRAAAGDERTLGRPATQMAATQDVVARDAVVDTTEMTTAEIVDSILTVVERRLDASGHRPG